MGNGSGEEIFEDAADKFQNTLDNLIESHHELNQRAIDLAKINILSASVISSVFVAIGLPEYYLIFGIGLAFMLLSTWYCIQVYRPRDVHMGVGSGAFSEIQSIVEDGKSEEHYHEEISKGLEHAIEQSHNEYNDELDFFQRGIWATAGGIVLIAAGSSQIVTPKFNSLVEYILIAIITVAVATTIYAGPKTMYNRLLM